MSLKLPAPKANAMLICDYVITEQGTRKKSLIGIFENISAARLPCTHPSLSVYIKLTDANGTYRFHLELIDLKNDKLIGRGDLAREVTIQNPLAVHELVFNLSNLRFAATGDFEFRIYANDRIFGQKTFTVSPLRRPEPEPPNAV